MKSSVWRRGVVNAQQFKICAWAWNPELQWGLGCRPQFAVCPCGDYGVRQWRPPPTFQVLLRKTDRQVLRAQGGSWRLRDDNLWNLIPLGDFWRGSVASSRQR